MLPPFKDEFEEYICERVFYGPHGFSGKPRDIAIKINIHKPFIKTDT
jgi:hypothetical protein